jgi:hypothetical protein
MRIIFEFSPPQQGAHGAEAPKPLRLVRGCPCCDRDILIESFSDGVVILRPFERQPPENDPDPRWPGFLSGHPVLAETAQ